MVGVLDRGTDVGVEEATVDGSNRSVTFRDAGERFGAGHLSLAETDLDADGAKRRTDNLAGNALSAYRYRF